MNIPKVKPECLQCNTFNPNELTSYRCACNNYCPGLYGEKEFKEGRLAFHLSKERDCDKACPYNFESGNDSNGNIHGEKSSLWINGWFNES